MAWWLSLSRRLSTSRRTDVYGALGVMLVVGGIAAILSRASADTFDSKVMGLVTTSLVDHHSVRVLTPVYPELSTPYSFYGIGMSLFMIPGVLAAKVLGVSEVSGTMVTNVWLLAALAGVVYAWTRLRHHTVGVSVVVAALIALGAGLLNFASTGLAEVLVALCIAAGLLAFTAIQQGRAWGPYLLGAAVGTVVLTRDDSAFLIVPWLVIGSAVVAGPGRRRSMLVRVVLAGIPFLVLWAIYNSVRFGDPWSNGYGFTLIFNHSLVTGVYGLLLSPGAGLVFYVPLVVVAAAGLVLAWRRERALSVVAIGLVVTRVLFYARYSIWFGGGSFGPRYVLPAMAALAVGLAPLLDEFHRFSRLYKTAIVGVAGLSCAIGVIGAAVSYKFNPVSIAVIRPAQDIPTEAGWGKYFGEPSTRTAVDHQEFDWGKFPISAAASDLVHRRHLAAAALAGPSDKLRAGIGALLLLVGVGALGGSAQVSRRQRTVSATTSERET